MASEISIFGKLKSGMEVKQITLTNGRGSSVSVLDYGVTLRRFVIDGTDILLGYDSITDYENANGSYIGATIGRFCNRIAGGRFTLDGKKIQLACNTGGGTTHIHGGNVGFDKRIWNFEILKNDSDPAVRFFRLSPDGEEGYPGTLRVMVTYTFTDENELIIRYEAVSDKDTLCSLTNHAYFNLEGEGSGAVTDHTFEFNCDTFTVVDQYSIPTGESRDVTGTPFDLREPTRLADAMKAIDVDEQLSFGHGFDHNFNINDPEAGLRFAVRVTAPKSGRTMDVFTDMPAVQFYAGNMLKGINPGKCGRLYEKREGFCLETQYAPDSINHPEFPDSVLRAGEKYDFTTIFSFDAE